MVLVFALGRPLMACDLIREGDLGKVAGPTVRWWPLERWQVML